MPLSYRELTYPTIEPVSLVQAKQHLRVDFDNDDTYISALITASRQYVEKFTNRAIFNRSMLLTCDYFPWPGWGTTGATNRDYFLVNYYRGLLFRLPFPSTVSVQSVSYLANDGVTVITIAPSNYIVDTISEPARISPAPGYTWPYQQNFIPGQVKVNFTAGTYEQPTSATVTVPSTSPYNVTLPHAASLVTLISVVDSDGDTIAYTNTAGTLTFDASQTGKVLTVAYTLNACPQTIVAAMLLIIGHLYEHRSENSEITLKTLPLGVEYLLASESFETLDWN